MKIGHYQIVDKYGDNYLLIDRLLSGWVRNQIDICIVSVFFFVFFFFFFMQMITNVYKDNSVLVMCLIRWKRLIPLFKLGENTFDSFHESAIYSFFDSSIKNRQRN